MDPYITGGVATVVTALVSVVTYLWRELKREQSDKDACLQRSAQLTAEVWSLHSRLEQLAWTGDNDPGAIIIIDANSGLILEWNPGATLMFHWTQRDMLGKPLTRIIPDRFRQQYADAMARVRTAGGLPRRGPFNVMGLTKEGTETPVTILLSGWSGEGQRGIGAAIKHRQRDASDSAAFPAIVSEAKK